MNLKGEGPVIQVWQYFVPLGKTTFSPRALPTPYIFNSSAGKKSVQTVTRAKKIARSTNDANKTRNKPLCDTRDLIARVTKV